MLIKIKVGNKINEINLNEEMMSEFKLKFHTIGLENSLEDFICNDVSDLVQNEIDNGLYGMFNY